MLTKFKRRVSEYKDIIKLVFVVGFAMLFTIAATGHSVLKNKLKALHERYFKWRQK